MKPASLRLPTLAALALAFSVFFSPVQAQKMTPGLWESSVTMKSPGGPAESKMDAANAQLQAKMASMTPEQRQMMEQAMASRGISIGAGGMAPKPNVMKVCVTKEQAERDEMPQQDTNRNCKQEAVTRSGSTVKFKFTCSGETQATGEGEFTMTGSTAYSGHTLINTVVQGRPQALQMEQSGKWLGADCGSVQPIKR